MLDGIGLFLGWIQVRAGAVFELALLAGQVDAALTFEVAAGKRDRL